MDKRRHLDSTLLPELQKNPSNIRNICILAHVDHGKTTLADSLVASNGIISDKLAGKLRYMDFRPDEQERGITMKSSSISLHHNYNDNDYLINIIDSPGHVDFASEVSTAVRLCDGALIVVDVVEGVCPQTRSALSMTYIEGLKPVLVLNKIDRLINELKLTPLDAYVHLVQVLEQVNAVMGELFTSDIMEREDKIINTNDKNNDDNSNDILMERPIADWQSALENTDDSQLYFSPEQGNVLFASSVDSWGFGISEFANIYSKQIGCSYNTLMKTLWGDYWLNVKEKKIMKNAQLKAKKPLFVSLILENIWKLNEIILGRKEDDILLRCLDKMNIKLTKRDFKLTDVKIKLQVIFSQWLPLAKTTLNMICQTVPSPNNLTSDKIERLMSGNYEFLNLPDETKKLKNAFLSCNSSDDSPIIAFVSKMFSIERKSLPEFKAKPLTQEELTQRHELARQRHAAKMELEKQNNGKQVEEQIPINTIAEINNHVDVNDDDDETDDSVLIAFARIYSGTIKEGSEVYILGPKHKPNDIINKINSGEDITPPSSIKELKNGCYITKTTIKKLYLLMGRDLKSIDCVPAGNVFGIGGLEDNILKTGTISTDIYCPSFSELTSLTVPILRVALEPVNSCDLQKLINGLKLLNQADSCALMHIQETGEIVLNTAGEVHLQRCLEDLKLHYAKIDIIVSEPIVPFRETIVTPPKTDMVNELITVNDNKKNDNCKLEFWTSNRQCYFVIDAKPLPDSVIKLIEKNCDLIKELDLYWEKFGKNDNFNLTDLDKLSLNDQCMSEKKQKAVDLFKAELSSAFIEAGWGDVIDKIWSFGPRKCGPNILLNESDYVRKPFWEFNSNRSTDIRASYDISIINGFQVATVAGPLCEEPMTGVCFVVNKLEIHERDSQSESGTSQEHLGGQLISTFKDACRRAFKLRRPRLVTPMYSCSVLVKSDVLGKLYAFFGRRQGRVIAADSAFGFGGYFRVLAILPVPESFQLARDLRTETSGLASPQLVFSHWEVIEEDPFWVPSTEEEYLHFGEKADSASRVKAYIDAVRKRKGLPIDSQVVMHAEKQRTLSKNK
ncbi:hypothetical protein HCN44_009545 [Aphidius gifuensis]|uniref:Ribosome assembly protein 1 n=1 Tax=Aphidius gifuensis TaxID=684658 RepID=A0A835CW53_APHGI|nr:elongation factor-like GTPase 1 [Aphidius gifuensis]KAF7998147.1 hypothetical protein HCN44_009545 [Aphidius gifuensis]